MQLQYFQKYLTSAPVVALITCTIIAVIAISLNLAFPGLNYGTYLKP